MKQLIRTTVRIGLHLFLLAGLLAGLLIAGGTQIARAASFTVANTADSGAGSLRQAILDANASSGADTITFTVSGTITLGSALPAISDDLTIDGTGQTITVDGTNTYQVTSVNSGKTVALKALTIANGSTNASGGGIINNGILNVDHSTFSANSASYAGAIYNNGGTLTVTDSSFSGNVSTYGGAIWNDGGTLTVTDSTFSGNNAISPLGGGGAIANTNSGGVTVLNSTFSTNSASASSSAAGGAIDNNSGTLTVTDSTFSGNSTDFGNGGGIYNNGGALNVTSSTFSGNQVANIGVGGAIYSTAGGTIANSTFNGNSTTNGSGGAIYFSGSMTISSSTISGNTASASGGGIYDGNVAQGNLGKVGNSIVALNTASVEPDIASAGELLLVHNDVLGISASVIASPTNMVGVNPLLGPLQYNGGPTKTMTLNTGSPAINLGASIDSYLGHVLPTDQRGLVRPQGGGYDVGAYEVGLIVPVISVSDVSQNEGNSGTSTFRFTVSLSTPPGQGGVTFDIATQDNSATTANSDYVQKSLLAQTIPAGSSTAYTFDVTVNGDIVAEPDETFFVNVSNVTGGALGDGQGQGTIINDDLQCPAGKYDNGSGCVDADPGYYVPAAGATSQTPCAMGYFQPFSGSVSCTQATAGHYVDVAASATQSDCLPGTYQPNTGAISCIMADAGYYVAGVAATEQIQCAVGFTSTAGAIACTPIAVNQTITFSALSNKTYGDPDFDVSATASSGLPVTFTASGNCTITVNTIHLIGAGSCTVTAHQTGNSNYNPAPIVLQSFTIAQPTPSITWTNPADIFYGTALGATQLNAIASVPGSFIYTPAASAVLNAGAGQTLHVDFTPTDTANYTNTSKNVIINVLANNQTIAFAALSNKTYGDPDFVVSATASSGLVVTFTGSGNCTVTGNTVHLTSAGSCTVTAHQTGNSNYNPAPDVARTFTIAQAVTSGPVCNGQAATIYVNIQNRIVGGPDNGKLYRGELNGTNGADVMVGTNGNDEINGKGGDDIICGGNGNDELQGGSGNDKLFGGAGKDTLYGSDGNDTLTGGTEADKFNGGSGTDTATDYTPSQGDTKSSVENLH